MTTTVQVEYRATYSGRHEGKHAFVQLLDSDGQVAAQSYGIVNAPTDDTDVELSGGEACFGGHDGDSGKLEAWVDLDDDDLTRCWQAFSAGSAPPCTPEPGDPYGVLEYTLKEKTNRVELVLGDP